MARTVPAGLAADLSAGKSTLARCLRLDLRDGTSVGITTHDQDISVDLGDGALAYKADTGVLPSAVKLSLGLEADNFEARGPVSSLITAAAVLGGRFDRARARLFDVDWSSPTDFTALLLGRVSERRVEAGEFVFEVRSRADAFNQVIGGQVGPYCRADYGDADCGVNLAPDDWSAALDATARADWDAKIGTVVKPTVFNGFWYEAAQAGTTGGSEPTWPTVEGDTVADGTTVWTARAAKVWPATITAAADGMVFTVGFSAGSPAADLFNGGTCRFLTGDLAGTSPVEVFDYGSGVVQLLVPAAAAPEIGDTLELTVPCLRTRAACRDNRNTWNMVRGFPDVPGSDDYLRFKTAGS